MAKKPQMQLEFNPNPTSSPTDLMSQYLDWQAQLEPSAPTIESRRNSQGFEDLEGSSSSHNWEAVYAGKERSKVPEQTVVTMSPLLYRMMLEQGHVSELVNYQIRIRRESWPQYLVRVLRHLSRIGQLP